MAVSLESDFTTTQLQNVCHLNMVVSCQQASSPINMVLCPVDTHIPCQQAGSSVMENENTGPLHLCSFFSTQPSLFYFHSPSFYREMAPCRGCRPRGTLFAALLLYLLVGCAAKAPSSYLESGLEARIQADSSRNGILSPRCRGCFLRAPSFLESAPYLKTIAFHFRSLGYHHVAAPMWSILNR
jgi:hypothetical protein